MEQNGEFAVYLKVEKASITESTINFRNCFPDQVFEPKRLKNREYHYLNIKFTSAEYCFRVEVKLSGAKQ